MKLIRCYHPPVNISHLADYILVPEDEIYNYTKRLYEKGLGHKVTPPQKVNELQEFFKWKARKQNDYKNN